jgi:hypothetical protein
LTQIPGSSSKSNDFIAGSSNLPENGGTIENSRDDLSSNEYEEFEEEIEEEIEEEDIEPNNESSPQRSAV